MLAAVLDAAALAATAHAAAPCPPISAAPASRTGTAQDTFFGVRVPDPYRWLEDAGSPEVQAWVADQNRASGSVLEALGKADTLEVSLRAVLGVERVGLPQRGGAWLMFTRQRAGQEQPVLVRKLGQGGSEETVLDPNAWPGEAHGVLGDWFLSPDGARLAYVVRRNNADLGELRVRELDSAAESPRDVLDWAEWGDFAWGPDSRSFYYTRLPPRGSAPVAELPGRADIACHRLGSPASADAAVCPASGDAQVYEGPQRSDDGRYLFIVRSRGFSGSAIEALDLSAPASAPVALFQDPSSTAQVLEDRGRFFLLGTADAPHGRILVRPANPAEAAWTVLVPERPDTYLDSARLVGGRLLLLAHRNAASVAELWSYGGRLERSLDLPGRGSVDEASGSAGDTEGFVGFQTFTRPEEVERFDPATGRVTAWSGPKDPPTPLPRAEVSQVWYPSRDGTRISMFLVRPQGQPRDGSARFLLQGYGGFAVPLLPRYVPATAALLQAGFGIAIPNLRGGGEYGEEWHRAGMLGNKQKVFDDFEAAARWLVAQNYTSPRRLAILGNSNGGLLVAAALVRHPELYGAAVCGSPLTDMLRYPLVGEGQAWVPEYGDPREEAGFRTLFAYSPYHQVRRADYPPTLLLCAENDDRVDPMHARKFAAALQAAQAGSAPILLATRAHAGHAGSGLESGQVDQLAQELGFIEAELDCGGAGAASARRLRPAARRNAPGRRGRAPWSGP